MGGRNVTIHLATQSKPQLRKRWGADGAAAIVNNSATILLFGGTRDADDLQGYATLLGERIERVATHDATGRVISHTTQRVPVLPAALIAQLRKGEVVIIRRGMPPALGTVPMVWKRRDVRTARRRQRRAERSRRLIAQSSALHSHAIESLRKAEAKRGRQITAQGRDRGLPVPPAPHQGRSGCASASLRDRLRRPLTRGTPRPR